MQSSIYEKLGISYLGKIIDEDGVTTDTPYLYKNKDLTTHGVIIGMTGSGKSGLGIGMIEEAAMDKVPCIIIDPKGDMGNLALLFENLSEDDFLEWIDQRDARSNDMSARGYAKATAMSWEKGLKSFGQSKERIAELKKNATVSIYTPGSSSGKEVSVLSSFEAPKEGGDRELISTLAQSTVASLLSLLNLKSDIDKASMLLVNIVFKSWQEGVSLSLEELISSIIKPPFQNLGLFPLEQVYPSNKRLELALEINGILANPSFAQWLEGEPLDIGKLLYEEDGRARVNIFTISHLNDNERMFFTTLLLNKLISWMRRQEGSPNLKLLFYMDEIFGYFPPNANPPSKNPMLLLLKQARAFGVGVVLATQNPVDLDYKGLSNIGSWFVGKLQTEQDQKRVAEGIAAASQGTQSKTSIKELLGTLKSRSFISKNIHEEGIKIFTARWVMSYLKGPMSSEDIKKISQKSKQKESGQQPTPQPKNSQTATQKPIITLKIAEVFISSFSAQPTYKPYIIAESRVYIEDLKKGIDTEKRVWSRLDLSNDDLVWGELMEGGLDSRLFLNSPSQEGLFIYPSSKITEPRFLRLTEDRFRDFVYTECFVEIFEAPKLKMLSKQGENIEDFRGRVLSKKDELLREEIEKIESRYKSKIEMLKDRLERANFSLQKEKQDSLSAKTDTILSVGMTVLGVLFGKGSINSTTISRGAGAARKVGKINKEQNDVKLAEYKISDIEQEIEDVSQELATLIERKKEEFEDGFAEIRSHRVKPKKSTITGINLIFVWDGSGV